MTIAFVFPGQGSQFVGMGRDYYENFPEAREVFEEVNEALSKDLTKIMFEGPEDLLTSTENAQPAIMAASIAVYRVFKSQLNITPRLVAGHSLGEYSALCASGAFSLTDTAKLLKIRGQAMQEATPKGYGAMAAILGLDTAIIEDITKQASQYGVCSIANDNCPGQIVISGNVNAVEWAIQMCQSQGAKKAMMLAVSAPFHCSLMQPAADTMKEALEVITINKPKVPALSNVTALPIDSIEEIQELLVKQIVAPVRFREMGLYLEKYGVTTTVEFGASKVLTGLLKRISPNFKTLHTYSLSDLDETLKQLQSNS